MVVNPRIPDILFTQIGHARAGAAQGDFSYLRTLLEALAKCEREKGPLKGDDFVMAKLQLERMKREYASQLAAL